MTSTRTPPPQTRRGGPPPLWAVVLLAVAGGVTLWRLGGGEGAFDSAPPTLDVSASTVTSSVDPGVLTVGDGLLTAVAPAGWTLRDASEAGIHAIDGAPDPAAGNDPWDATEWATVIRLRNVAESVSDQSLEERFLGGFGADGEVELGQPVSTEVAGHPARSLDVSFVGPSGAGEGRFVLLHAGSDVVQAWISWPAGDAAARARAEVFLAGLTVPIATGSTA